ncbi:MAG TPA: histidine kinase [Acidimicrobiales bacterium]|nr:histidine kinase [Acidimicrobiales bacterium]
MALVARAPVPIRRKLVVAFGAVVALLVTIAGIGTYALGQSNERTERIATLQRRVSVYRQLQSTTMFKLYVAATALTDTDPDALDAALRQLNDSYDFERLRFLARDEGSLVSEIQAAYDQFVNAMTAAIDLGREGALDEALAMQLQARPVAETLVRLTDQLVNKAESDSATLARENERASRSSRRLFIVFAAGGIGLALLLGFVISSSIIGPITQMNRRLGELAQGEFDQRLELANRDELGMLAVNLNAMSDELGRLYKDLGNWNRTLEARVAEQVRELEASRARVVAAADAARRRIERDLHDGAQQHLVALDVNLQLARALLAEDPGAAEKLLDELATNITDAIDELRNLAHGIYPPLLVDSGLSEALRAAAAGSASRVRVDTSGIGRFGTDVEAAVYFCCLEALQNAAKHAPGANVTVTVREEAGGLRFEIADDGPGFDPDAVRHGHGFTNMSDRLGAVGGQVHWESAPGRGTRIVGTLPLAPVSDGPRAGTDGDGRG